METYYPQPAVERAMKIQEVILRAINGKINWIQAAEIIGISDRQMRRWKRRYQKCGYDGLYDRRRKRPSPRRVPLNLAEKVLKLYKEQYFDFNAKHFHEKLIEEHNINLSYNWIRLALQGAGLTKKRTKHDKHRKRRQPKPLIGMMLHMDASTHNWLNTDKYYDLVTLLDDSNNRLYDIELTAQEDAHTCLSILKSCIEKRGVFCSLYTDRASHFFLTRKAGEKVDKGSLTQIGRALAELNITHIPSYSPEARGRAERLFKTLQGRLPQEFRLRGIKTKEQANEYLKKVYIKEHNRRFSRRPEQKGSAFMPVPNHIDLDRIFCFKHERSVNNDNTVSFNNRIFQIAPCEFRISFAKCKVTIYEHLDESISIGYGPHILGYYTPKELSTNKKTRNTKRKKSITHLNQKRTDHLLQKADILTCY
jgi:transposase